jgi:hypothetical protein
MAIINNTDEEIYRPKYGIHDYRKRTAKFPYPVQMCHPPRISLCSGILEDLQTLSFGFLWRLHPTGIIKA